MFVWNWIVPLLLLILLITVPVDEWSMSNDSEGDVAIIENTEGSESNNE